MEYTMRQIRRALVAAAYEWRDRVVRDFSANDPTPELIGDIVRRAGAEWDLGEDGAYDTESDAEWCGYFVAACASMVGDYLEDGRCVPVTLRDDCRAGLASTYKIRTAKFWPDDIGPPHEIARAKIRQGDILLFDWSGDGPDHIAIATGSPAGGEVPTVEGNGSGLRLGDGTIGEGVGTTRRPVVKLHHARRLHRDHFTAVRDGGNDKVATTDDGEACELCQQADGYCHLHAKEE